ncbi:MAG TPA: CAP domain-containing protein [Chitinophagaceae bacterium]|nr:CAP domain-containing protein [Chitinophagaceae bacterium]
MKTILLTTAFIFLIIISQAQQVPDNTGSSVSKEDAQQALDLHNKYRADVGTPPLEWSTELAAFAQDWANQLVANDCAFEHRQNSPYGENIFMGGGSWTVMDATNAWYDEIKKFDINNPEANFSETGHYTQIVWRTTTKLGMGVGVCSNGNYIIVANYDPPGNMSGEKPY